MVPIECCNDRGGRGPLMATIITVHGTFAHMGGEPSEVAAPGVDPQWWQRGSPTEADL